MIVSSEGSRLRFVRRRIKKINRMASARHEKSIPSDACEAVQPGRSMCIPGPQKQGGAKRNLGLKSRVTRGRRENDDFHFCIVALDSVPWLRRMFGRADGHEAILVGHTKVPSRRCLTWGEEGGGFAQQQFDEGFMMKRVKTQISF